MKVRWLIPLLLSGSSAVADAVHVVGTAAPLPGSTIVSVEGGRVVYTDLTGKRRQRGIEEIQSLSFDRHSAIDLAEARLAAGNAEAARIRDRHRIEVAVTGFAGRLWCRVSAQAYNSLDDYRRLAEAISPDLVGSAS